MTPLSRRLFLGAVAGSAALGGTAPNALASDADDVTPIGLAEIDVTPDYPVRLSGFGFRRSECEGVTQRIWAKAMAIGDQEQGPVVLITVDNLGVSDELVGGK